MRSYCCGADWMPKLVYCRPWIDGKGNNREEKVIVNVCKLCGMECDVIDDFWINEIAGAIRDEDKK